MTTLMTVIVYLVLQMVLVWGVYRVLKNPSVVDTSWSLGLMVAGLIYLGAQPLTTRSVVISMLLVLWALRLAGYLWYTRVRHGHVDKRYTELSNEWKINKSLGFFLNFQLQGLFIFILSFLFYLISHTNNAELTLMDVLAIVIVLIGIIGESVADLQLNRFKKNHRGSVCNQGLWHYSRHPNYFFDWLTWLGFTLFALQSDQGYLSLASLLFLYWLFTKLTAPITERSSIQSKGQQYLDYQQQTSMFFPWFKKK